MSTSRVSTTVTGEIGDDQLGPTLAREHLDCDISNLSGRADNKIVDVALIAEELVDFRRAGGGSIVEKLPEGIGRDAVKLRNISKASVVPVISGIAFHDRSTYPQWVPSATVDAIADCPVREIEEGSDGVRAGLIGERLSHKGPAPNPSGYRLHESEKRVFAATVKAQQRTGVAISMHASLGRAGHGSSNTGYLWRVRGRFV